MLEINTKASFSNKKNVH